MSFAEFCRRHPPTAAAKSSAKLATCPDANNSHARDDRLMSDGIMSRDAPVPRIMEQTASTSQLPVPDVPPARPVLLQPSRMQYRSRPVSVAVDPVSLVISECITITSAIQKHARSAHSSVSAILGGTPNPVQLGPPSPVKGRAVGPGDGSGDSVTANRWGLRGKKGKSMADHPLISAFGRLRHDLTGVKGARCLP